MTTKPSFVYVTYISTTPEKLWDALLDPEMTKQYWGVKKNVSDWKVGSPWAHRDYETEEAAVVGAVLESDPPKRLSLSWSQTGGGAEAERPSRVTFEIQPFMGSVKLTVTHDELVPDSPMARGASEGWPAILSSLKTLLESGSPLPMTTRRWGGPPKAD